MKRPEFTKYRLKGGKTPVSWALPLKNVTLTDPEDPRRGKRKIHYVPNADSIFLHKYSGDEKAKPIVFENGILKADLQDLNLIEILERHPWKNIHYERIDENLEASKQLAKIELKEKALAKVNIADPDERKAAAIVLIGQRVFDYTPERVTAELKLAADADPARIIEQMERPGYKNSFITSLALMRGVIKINDTRTAVTWEDGNVIVRVAVGQNPVERMTEFLSGDGDQSIVTLQTIGEKIKRSYTKTKALPGDEVIDYNAPEEEEEEVSEEEQALLDAQEEYKEVFGKKLPPNMKNNLEWIQNKIEEAKKQ
jgi:hypothetical protein